MIPAASIARRLRRHWALWVAVALFLATGTRGVDIHGPFIDIASLRPLGNAQLDYVLGDGERAFDQLIAPGDRYYGVAVETPLALIERLLDGSRVFAGRAFLTHLFFLAGGVCCYLLVLRLFNNRLLALVAVALFLLHPRIYAHSFYNSKDIPFLVMFMLSLYLLHRAFRRETVGAFILCGAVVGLLVNLRILGLLLFAAVLALRALDLPAASGGKERRRILLTGGAFALAAVLALYGTLPGIWTDPAGQFVAGIRHFRILGENGLAYDEWLVLLGITTPPATLLLILIGAVALAWHALRHPHEILRNSPLRLALLLAALPVFTVVTAVAFDVRFYGRHLFFLHAPLLLLAIVGLGWLVGAGREGGRWPRAGAYGLAGTAVAVALVSMVRIHPYEDSYFSVLTDRTTPERVISRYGVGHQSHVVKGALGDIIEDHPSGKLALMVAQPYRITPRDDLKRFVATRDFRSGERNFLVLGAFGGPCSAPLYTGRVYASTLWCVVDPVAHFGGYRREALATEPLDRSRFDAYRVDDVMVYVRDGCSAADMDLRFFLHVHTANGQRHPSIERRVFDFAELGVRIDGDCVAVHPLPDYPIAHIETGQYTPGHARDALRAVAGREPLARSHFTIWLDPDGQRLIYAREECSVRELRGRAFLHVYPVAEESLSDQRAKHGFDNLDFDFGAHGVLADGICVVTASLPDYPIAHIRTGQPDEWAAWVTVSPPAVDPAALAGEPLARAVFDVWLDGDALVYVKDGCTEADAAAAFFLHLYPVDADDLPDASREHGFENRDFHLWQQGTRTDGRCVALVALPDYPIARVETGQYDATGRLWWVDFALPD